MPCLQQRMAGLFCFAFCLHVGGWGELDREDLKENEFSLVNGFRLLSHYRLADGRVINIITEADRSATTILLPEEY